MRNCVAACIVLLLAACSSSGQSTQPGLLIPPVSQGAQPPAITEMSVPAEPLYVAAAVDGSVYFGFGSSGTGSALYRYDGGALSQTQPASAPSGYDPGGGVYGIDAAANGSVYWLSAYFGGAQSVPYVFVECGANGGRATLCEPNIPEPTSTLVDGAGVFWNAGITSAGGGQIVTSGGQRFDSNTDGVLQIINGPGNAVWGLLERGFPVQDSIVRFAVSGSSIAVAQRFVLPAGSAAGSMTVGGDGAIWFTDYGASKIGRITAQGALSEFASPHAINRPSYGQVQIATACNGLVWYTESNFDAAVSVDSAGHVTEFAMPSSDAYPAPIAGTPPGAACKRVLWVGEVRASKLAAVRY